VSQRKDAADRACRSTSISDFGWFQRGKRWTAPGWVEPGAHLRGRRARNEEQIDTFAEHRQFSPRLHYSAETRRPGDPYQGGDQRNPHRLSPVKIWPESTRQNPLGN